MIYYKIPALLFFFLFVVGFTGNCQNKKSIDQQVSINIPHFPPPKGIEEVDNEWKRDGFWQYQDYGNPYSPRKLSGVTGPKYNVHSFKDAIKDFQQDAGIVFAQIPVLEKLEVWEHTDGRDMRLSLTPTKFADAKGILFLLVSKEKNSDQYKLMAVEMAEKTFQEWGGIPQMLVLRGIIDFVDVYPEDKRQAIANAPLYNQVALYEASLDALAEEFGLVMTMYTQQQLFNSMQKLNYDIILGQKNPNPNIY